MKSKAIFIVIFACYFTLCSFGQAVEAKYKNGSAFLPQTAILAQDTIIFQTTHGENMNCWNLFVYMGTGEQTVLAASSGEANFFQISASIMDVDWSNALRCQPGGDSSIYFKGFVVASNGWKMDLLFNFLPSKPVIREVSLVYDYFDYKNVMFDADSRIEMLVNTTRDESLFLDYTEHFLYKGEDDLFFHVTDYFLNHEDPAGRIKKEGNDMYKIWEICDWGQYFRVYAQNKYGLSFYSDTIFTTDLIKDETILETINKSTNIQDIKNQNVEEIQVVNKKLCLSAYPKLLRIYDNVGREIFKKNVGKSVDLSSYAEGAYIIIVSDKEKCITKKIIL